MKFSEIQRETYTNDELCLFLKFHLRIASSACLVLPGIQIYFTQFSNLEFHPFIYTFCALTQICLIILGIIGLIYSFEYIKKLQQSNSTYYETQDDLISRGLFIITCFLIGLIINLGIVSPIIFNIGIQSKIAQMEQASFEDVQLFQQAIQSENTLLIEILLIAAQAVSLLFIGYVFLLFSKNITTYNYFIYIMAIFTNILALRVFKSQVDIQSLTKVNFIPSLDNQFLVTFISQTSLLICLLILFLFLMDVTSTYIRLFKNPIFKFILGNVLIGLSFALVGSNGQLIRNLSLYQQKYQMKEDCRNYMNFIPQPILENIGCKNKYFGKTESQFLTCPKDQQTQVWENQKVEMGCLNWNCCGLISQVLLNPYITYCFVVNLENIFLIMLAIMLFQIRLVQDNAISQTIKLIALFLSISIIIVGIFTANTSPDIQVYRKVYLEPQNYLPINNVNTLPAHTRFQSIDWLPELCSTSISSDTVNKIRNSINYNELILSINDGVFLINNVNQENLFIYQFQENDIEYLYLKGTKENILFILENRLQICIYTTQASINWEIIQNHRKYHRQIIQKPSEIQQQTLSKILTFISVHLIKLEDKDLKGQIQLFDSLIYNCQDQNRNSFMKIVDTQESETLFHNYPKGQYGTILFQQESFQSCIYFQTNQNLYIQPTFPIKSDLSIILQWFGPSDLDLIVENSICKVGPKNSINCGAIKSQHDSLIGNQQLSTAPIGEGEQITIEYLSSFDYLIYIQITMTKDEYQNSNHVSFQDLLIQSNAQVQLFTQTNKFPQANISVRQIVLQEQNDVADSLKQKWLVGCIKNGKQLKIINNIQIQTKC